MDVKEIALRVANDSYKAAFNWYAFDETELTNFAQSLIAEIQKQNEPVAMSVLADVEGDENTLVWKTKFHAIDDSLAGKELFTFPPSADTIESLRARVAELEAELETAKDSWSIEGKKVDVKDRRISELEANAATMKAYYEQVFADGGSRISELKDQLAAKDQRIAELEYQLDVVTNNPDDPAYWLHSSKQLLEKS